MARVHPALEADEVKAVPARRATLLLAAAAAGPPAASEPERATTEAPPSWRLQSLATASVP